MSSTPTEKKKKRKFEWFWWFVDIIIDLIYYLIIGLVKVFNKRIDRETQKIADKYKTTIYAPHKTFKPHK